MVYATMIESLLKIAIYPEHEQAKGATEEGGFPKNGVQYRLFNPGF